MYAGSFAQMAHAPFGSTHGHATPSGLASRRGGQNIKPLSFDGTKLASENDTGIPTPRTSRSHLLQGLRTQPKTATAANFPNGPASPTTFGPQPGNRNSIANVIDRGLYDSTNLMNGPKTSMPRFATAGQQPRSQGYNSGVAGNFGQQQYTAEQVLAPPQLQLDEVSHEQIDPNLHAQLMYTNAYLSEQQQKLQQQLRALQAAAQQFQGLNLGSQMSMMQQAYPNMYSQQVNAQAMMMNQAAAPSNVYQVYDPATGQTTLYVDQSQAQAQAQIQAQLQAQMNHQSQLLANQFMGMQQANAAAPRVQVSPPPENKTGFRNPSPPRRFDSPTDNHQPLPPPSANAFRRGHKKSSSTANGNKGLLSITTEEPPKTAGPKTATFPLTPMTAGYGPGQARAGEHPVRQPRNPPEMDDLKSKPTAKHEGSKNFVTRTRRSAVHNLVRAGLERRKDARSNGSISPISESAEETETPLTDNDSDSGRSGSGSLVEPDDAESSLPSSRTSTGSWGAIGSDRPSSRQKLDRGNVDSNNSSDSESTREPGSFASLLKTSSRGSKIETVDGQRKAPMLVLGSAEKRKLGGS